MKKEKEKKEKTPQTKANAKKNAPCSGFCGTRSTNTLIAAARSAGLGMPRAMVV